MLRHLRSATLITVATVVCVGVIFASPLALSAFEHVPPTTLYRRSLIGQTYGAVAAVISGLALIGVVVSIRYQRREATAARSHNMRTLHISLMRMALGDPDLLLAWGPFGSGDITARRQHIYVNLVLSYWQMLYSLGELPDSELRVISHDLFAGEAGQLFWANARTIRLRTEGSKLDRRFHQIIDEEARRALVDGNN